MTEEVSPEFQAKVLGALDETVLKLRGFIVAAMMELSLPEEEVKKVTIGLNQDTLLYVPVIRKVLSLPGCDEAIDQGKVDFFRALFPKERQQLEIPKHLSDKGLLFAKVFRSLLRDLDK